MDYKRTIVDRWGHVWTFEKTTSQENYDKIEKHIKSGACHGYEVVCKIDRTIILDMEGGVIAEFEGQARMLEKCLACAELNRQLKEASQNDDS